MKQTMLMELAKAKAYDAVLTFYPEHAHDSIVEVADFLRTQDRYQVALSLYQYLLKTIPIDETSAETAQIYYGIGQCYGKTYQYAASLPYLQLTFEIDRDRSEGSNYYAYILERNSWMEQAAQWYQKALSNGYAEDLWTLSHHAYFLEKIRQPEAAAAAYEAVLQRNPNYTWALKRYALFLLKQNQADRSQQLMQAALQRNNPFAQINYLEYLILCKDGDGYEAFLQSLDYHKLPLPFQTLVDLFDYFWYYLLQGRSDTEKLTGYERKIQALTDSIHRDFDDLTELLIAQGGDLKTWQAMTRQLVK
jgi:tetratricopeptide (TPR) repeat protein